MAFPLKKEVKLSEKDNIILNLLKNNPEGLRIDLISKTLKLPRRTSYNHLNKLLNLKLIENYYPIWKCAKNSGTMPKMAQSKIQSHKFSFKLDLIKKPEWWDKRENRFTTLDLNFHRKQWGNVKYSQIKQNQFIIGFFPNSIYFINQKEYYDSEPYLALESAILDTIDCLNHFENQFKFKFFDNLPNFKIRSNHYVKLKDAFAQKCKESNNMIKIEVNGKLRAWVDLSEPFGLETGDKNYGVEDMDRYKIHIEDIIVNKPPTNSELSNNLNKLILLETNRTTEITNLRKDLNYVAKNQISHVRLIEKASKVLSKLDKRLSNKGRNINLTNGTQKKIFDF